MPAAPLGELGGGGPLRGCSRWQQQALPCLRVRLGPARSGTGPRCTGAASLACPADNQLGAAAPVRLSLAGCTRATACARMGGRRERAQVEDEAGRCARGRSRPRMSAPGGRYTSRPRMTDGARIIHEVSGRTGDWQEGRQHVRRAEGRVGDTKARGQRERRRRARRAAALRPPPRRQGRPASACARAGGASGMGEQDRGCEASRGECRGGTGNGT